MMLQRKCLFVFPGKIPHYRSEWVRLARSYSHHAKFLPQYWVTFQWSPFLKENVLSQWILKAILSTWRSKLHGHTWTKTPSWENWATQAEELPHLASSWPTTCQIWQSCGEKVFLIRYILSQSWSKYGCRPLVSVGKTLQVEGKAKALRQKCAYYV